MSQSSSGDIVSDKLYTSVFVDNNNNNNIRLISQDKPLDHNT